MNTVDAIIIAKNAENLLQDCLESLSFCTKIILIDGGSNDNTVEIAKRHGAIVFEHKVQDFSEMRNFGLRKSTAEWVFYIDVDERVTEDLAGEIKKIVTANEETHAAYKIKRKNFYLGKNAWPYIETLERLFRREKLQEWYGSLHESPRVKGTIGEIHGFLLHYTHRTLIEMLEKTITWSGVEAKLRFDANHPKMTWWRFIRPMTGTFYEFFIRQGGWRVGTVGVIESIYQVFSIFFTYARLWELQQHDRKK